MSRSRRILTDNLWKKLEPILPPPKTPFRGRPRTRDREVIEGILWVIRTGAPWRDLPADFPSWPTCYHRFRTWTLRGVWKEIFEFLCSEDPDNEWHMIDSTTVRAHVHAAGMNSEEATEALGRSRGGFSTKIHFKTDAFGIPLKILLSPGNQDDSTMGIQLIEDSGAQYVLGDAGYDTNAIRDFIGESGMTAVIRPSRRRAIKPRCDWALYKARNAIERFIGQMKQWRRVATRYDKLAPMFLATATIVASVICLKTLTTF
mgnify:CR=1 FL=1